MKQPDSSQDPLRPASTVQLLRRMRAGEPGVERRLFELLYAELHARAEHLMRRQRSDHTLQATALVNEAWLRLCAQEPGTEIDRVHFLRLAAKAMRSVLVDHARARASDKRGGGAGRVSLEKLELAIDAPSETLLALDEALTRFHALDADLARVAEMRLFGGLEHEEIAAELGVSSRTCKRAWKTAQSWLQRELSAPTDDAGKGLNSSS